MNLYFILTLMFTNFLFEYPYYMHPISIKKCPNCSRIVSDTEYITNLRTINLKINMLVSTFCAPSSAIQPKTPSSGANIIYILQNWKCFSFILQKLKDPISSLCHMKKLMYGVFHAWAPKILLGAFRQLPESI